MELTESQTMKTVKLNEWKEESCGQGALSDFISSESMTEFE